LKQLADVTGIRLPKQTSGEHNALDDAMWVKSSCDIIANVGVK